MNSQNSDPLLPYPRSPWDNNENTIWLASSLKLFRNLENSHFPGKLTVDQRKQLLDIITPPLLDAPGLEAPVFLQASDLEPLHKEYLYEHFLSAEGFHHAQAGDGFVIDQSGGFLGILNIRNHLQLALLDHHGELEASYSRLVDIETTLGKSLNYAYSPEFGFLTADPSQSGTGLKVHIFLHVPALLHLNELLHTLTRHSDDNVLTGGLQGDPEALVGDVLVLHNRFSLGVTEENIISSLRSFATHLMLEEKSARQRILETGAEMMKDEVSRAFALVKHAYQIETLEALEVLSLLKLGLDLEWIKGIDARELNRLFFTCRRAHLIADLNKQIPNEELAHARASYLHEASSGITITI